MIFPLKRESRPQGRLEIAIPTYWVLQRGHTHVDRFHWPRRLFSFNTKPSLLSILGSVFQELWPNSSLEQTVPDTGSRTKSYQLCNKAYYRLCSLGLRFEIAIRVGHQGPQCLRKKCGCWCSRSTHPKGLLPKCNAAKALGRPKPNR